MEVNYSTRIDRGICVDCGLQPTRNSNSFLCEKCRKKADRQEEEARKECDAYERQRMGKTLEEYAITHPSTCPRCQGRAVLTFFCFWAEAGDYDWEKGWRGQDWK